MFDECIFRKFLVFFCIIFIFFTKFSHNFFAKFSFSISWKSRIFSRNRLKQNFRIFRERTKCKNKAKWSRKKIISRNHFFFSLKTLSTTQKWNMSVHCTVFFQFKGTVCVFVKCLVRFTTVPFIDRNARFLIVNNFICNLFYILELLLLTLELLLLTL